MKPSRLVVPDRELECQAPHDPSPKPPLALGSPASGPAAGHPEHQTELVCRVCGPHGLESRLRGGLSVECSKAPEPPGKGITGVADTGSGDQPWLASFARAGRIGW
jgi:hypothetical protein